MAKKQNPVLAAFEAKMEANFLGRLACNTEINLIAMLVGGNRLVLWRSVSMAILPQLRCKGGR